MKGKCMHADWAILPRGQFSKRPDILLGAEIELSSSFVKLLLDKAALLLMLLAMLILTLLVAIPNAPAPVAHLQSISLLFARRAELLGFGPIFRSGFGFIFLSSFHRFVDRHGTELLSSRRCTVLFG